MPDEGVELGALAGVGRRGAAKALDADVVLAAVRLAPAGGEDVVDAVRLEVAGAQFPLSDVGRMGGGVEDQGAAIRAFGEQGGQRVEAADVVAILGDGALAVALGDELMAAVGTNGEHAAGFRAQHVDEVGEPFGAVVGGRGRRGIRMHGNVQKLSFSSN